MGVKKDIVKKASVSGKKHSKKHSLARKESSKEQKVVAPKATTAVTLDDDSFTWVAGTGPINALHQPLITTFRTRGYHNRFLRVSQSDYSRHQAAQNNGECADDPRAVCNAAIRVGQIVKVRSNSVTTNNVVRTGTEEGGKKGYSEAEMLEIKNVSSLSKQQRYKVRPVNSHLARWVHGPRKGSDFPPKVVQTANAAVEYNFADVLRVGGGVWAKATPRGEFRAGKIER
jgi:hypothetical protein